MLPFAGLCEKACCVCQMIGFINTIGKPKKRCTHVYLHFIHLRNKNTKIQLEEFNANTRNSPRGLNFRHRTLQKIFWKPHGLFQVFALKSASCILVCILKCIKWRCNNIVVSKLIIEYEFQITEPMQLLKTFCSIHTAFLQSCRKDSCIVLAAASKAFFFKKNHRANQVSNGQFEDLLSRCVSPSPF